MIALATSNTLKNTDGFQTALIRYRGNESQYDLDWLNAPSDFYIQVRIPATLQNTKFPISETTYRQSDGYFRRAKTFIEKTKELIQKVPLEAYDNIRNSYKTSKKSGRQIPKKKESHKLEQLKREKGEDFVFDREEMDRFAEMLHIIQDMQEEKEDFEEVEPQNIDHAHDVQALLLEYRRLFQETVDFIRAKKQDVPQSILDAIKHIDNQIGHWAGR